MKKEIIGYKIKSGYENYEPAAVKIVQTQCDNKHATRFSEFQADTSFDRNQTSFAPNSMSARLLEKAGVLDLWFEPVYKEEPQFKVGDWIYDIHGKFTTIKDRVTVITKISNNQIWSLDRPNKKDSTQSWIAEDEYHETYRLATPEEIAAAQKKVITLRHSEGTFEVTVSKNRIESHGTMFLINFLHAILNESGVSGSPFNAQYSHITIGCKKAVPLEDIEMVLNAYNEINK